MGKLVEMLGKVVKQQTATGSAPYAFAYVTDAPKILWGAAAVLLAHRTLGLVLLVKDMKPVCMQGYWICICYWRIRNQPHLQTIVMKTVPS